MYGKYESPEILSPTIESQPIGLENRGTKGLVVEIASTNRRLFINIEVVNVGSGWQQVPIRRSPTFDVTAIVPTRALLPHHGTANLIPMQMGR